MQLSNGKIVCHQALAFEISPYKGLIIMAKKITILILLILLLTIVTSCIAPENYVSIEYRDTPVNIASSKFEYLNTDRSSFINGAWYDKKNKYMIISLNEVYYHYCGMPESVWMDFTRAESFGRFYNQAIKGQYDCRKGHVPDY